jgi:hypothetical protein
MQNGIPGEGHSAFLIAEVMCNQRIWGTRHRFTFLTTIHRGDLNRTMLM